MDIGTGIACGSLIIAIMATERIRQMDIGTGIACGSLIIAIMVIILKIIPSRSKGDIYNKELCKTVHTHLLRELKSLKLDIKELYNKIDELIKSKF